MILQEQLLQVLAPYRGQRGALIPVLQKAQETLGYLSEATISEIADFLSISRNEIYGVASFYAQFRFERQGKHTVRVCQGTACHVRGGRRIMERAMQELGIRPGETRPDYKFSLEKVACFGSCALAPVMVMDKTVYGRMTTVKVKQLLTEYEEA
ncbi:MAG: NADH-quinone oxidoreductase subunit NuoE [Chloroflexi bacterium]|nr:NADH-quinone oxidoreductase subunit NuoE [Chloroflexota bacterium]MBI2979391.1 NADH-quinone oxidoreductase subunit NuoE [Chloroflexota bacterium]